MTLRFKTETALCVAFATIMCATSAHADSGYFPYYEQNRDTYQFASMAAPVSNGVPVQTPPSYPQTNWQPPKTSIEQHDAQIMAPTVPLGTVSGLDAGIQGSYYNYDEQSSNINKSGPQIGFIADATVMSPTHIFDTLGVRYAYGNLGYSDSTGSSSDHENSTWEIRDIVGQDFIWQRYALSPYIGIGYRNLYNDSKGTTSLGNGGISTLSQYLYIPFGVKPQVRLDGSDVLKMDVEADYLVHGWQTSHLGDNGDGDPTIRSGQGSGVGFRGEAMWDTGTWAFGPFINYWSVPTSSNVVYSSPHSTCGAATCVGNAPHNTTVEGGVQLKYHFLNF